MAALAVTGASEDYMVGSRVEYCGVCDEPPVLRLGTPNPSCESDGPSVALGEDD